MIFENAQNERGVHDAPQYLEKSSQLGHHPAKSYLGSVLLHNVITNREKLKDLDLLKTAALAGSDNAARKRNHIYLSGLYGEAKNLCIADFWFAFTLKKNTIIHNSPVAKISNCRNGEKITILE